MSENAIYQGRRIFIEVKYVHFADIMCTLFMDVFTTILCSNFCLLFTEFFLDFVYWLVRLLVLYMLFLQRKYEQFTAI